MKHTIAVILGSLLLASNLDADMGIDPDTPEQTALPAPDRTAGKPLMQALQLRQSTRSFKATPLPDIILGNLLWAANGINRPVDGKRTAPSARNWQEIDVYIARADGLFRYQAGNHMLERLSNDDLRPHTGLQPFVTNAPLVLVYVADTLKMKGAEATNRSSYAAVDTGFISQNVYLFCASEGLATVVLGMVDKPALHAAMRLRTEQEIVLTQPVGYPAE